MRVLWQDGGREPKCQPNPAFPLGRDIDVSAGAAAACKQSLPYPAKRCGQYLVNCDTCGQNVLVSTAGRVDDPRSVKIACKLVKPGH
jgi:hypothetical protein